MTPQKMQPQNTPKVTPQMGADKAMSNLGFTNTMLQHYIEYKGGQSGKASQTPQNAPQQSQNQGTVSGQAQAKPQQQTPPQDENEAKMTKLELDMSKKIDDLRKELDDKHKLELDSLRNDIKEALDAEEQNEPK